MVERMAEVTRYKRDKDGHFLSSSTSVENVASPPAQTIGDWRQVVVAALNILGTDEFRCPECSCEGCRVERDYAIRRMLDALDYETYTKFYAAEVVGKRDDETVAR